MTLQLTAQVKVKGYYKKNGTYVQPHYRSNPDGNPYNNWSYPGNTNPYTGKTATGNLDTYLKNYYNRSSNSSSYYVTVKLLNVHSGPSANYSVVGSLSYADNVKIIESNNNGWKKVQYDYYDTNSYSLKTKTGYISGSYISLTNPSFNDSYSNTDNYSNLNSSTSPYGFGNGRITIWTNCDTDGDIKVYLDGSYIGKLTLCFLGEPPNCGDIGTLSVNKPAGTYKIEAKGNKNIWSGTITITEDRCLRQGLQK